MFEKRAWLGQVPLVWGPSSWGAGIIPPARPAAPPPPGSSMREGDEISATGGRIVKRIGFLWFFPDEEVLDKIEAATGERPSESVEAQVKFCNQTPQTFPVLGDFTDPDTGLVCFLDLPEGWNDAWMGWGDLEAKMGESKAVEMGRAMLGEVRLARPTVPYLGRAFLGAPLPKRSPW